MHTELHVAIKHALVPQVRPKYRAKTELTLYLHEPPASRRVMAEADVGVAACRRCRCRCWGRTRDAVLDLQAVLGRVYDAGGSAPHADRLIPDPPLDADDAAWARGLLAGDWEPFEDRVPRVAHTGGTPVPRRGDRVLERLLFERRAAAVERRIGRRPVRPGQPAAHAQVAVRDRRPARRPRR